MAGVHPANRNVLPKRIGRPPKIRRPPASRSDLEEPESSSDSSGVEDTPCSQSTSLTSQQLPSWAAAAPPPDMALARLQHGHASLTTPQADSKPSGGFLKSFRHRNPKRSGRKPEDWYHVVSIPTEDIVKWFEREVGDGCAQPGGFLTNTHPSTAPGFPQERE